MLSILQLYNKVLNESLIFEAMSLEDIYEKYYKNDVPNYHNFRDILYVDPTSMPKEALINPHVKITKKGKYLDWIIKKCFKVDKRKFDEDAPKIRDDLELFDKNQSKIGKQITQIKDQYELSKLVQEFRKKKEAGEIDLSRSEIKAGAEKIYDKDNWLIVHPKTEESAKYYGAHTRWCTAAEGNNMFGYYNSKGPLYIVINKKDSEEKYQFHFQEQQYMDIEDDPIEIKTYKHFYNNILDKLVELSKENGELINFVRSLPADISAIYITKYREEFNKRVLGEKLSEKYHSLKDNEIIKLIDDGADLRYDEYVLSSLVINNQFDIIKHIVETKKDKEINHILFNEACLHGLLNIVKYLVENHTIEDIHYKNELPLHNAIHGDRLNIVKYLFEKGNIDVNYQNGYALTLAALYGNFDIVKYLVEEKKAKLNLGNSNSEDLHYNALYYAAKIGSPAIVHYLVEKGQQISKYDISASAYSSIRDYLEEQFDKQTDKNKIK